MKKIVKLVDLSFMNSHEYFENSVDIQNIKEELISTFIPSKKAMFENILYTPTKSAKMCLS